MKSFRKATIADLSSIVEIVNQASQHLKKHGVNQWQEDRPLYERFVTDLDESILYVLEDNQEVIGFCVIMSEPDVNYLQINGSWLSNRPYHAIHRFAIDKAYYGKGVSDMLMQAALACCVNKNVRIDTHEDNRAMRKCIERHGFKECGIISLANGSKRIAYELVKDSRLTLKF